MCDKQSNTESVNDNQLGELDYLAKYTIEIKFKVYNSSAKGTESKAARSKKLGVPQHLFFMA